MARSNLHSPGSLKDQPGGKGSELSEDRVRPGRVASKAVETKVRQGALNMGSESP